jgi:hypothetical protein
MTESRINIFSLLSNLQRKKFNSLLLHTKSALLHRTWLLNHSMLCSITIPHTSKFSISHIIWTSVRAGANTASKLLTRSRLWSRVSVPVIDLFDAMIMNTEIKTLRTHFQHQMPVSRKYRNNPQCTYPMWLHFAQRCLMLSVQSLQFFSLHAWSSKHQVTVTFASHFRTVSPQHVTCYMSSSRHLEFWAG